MMLQESEVGMAKDNPDIPDDEDFCSSTLMLHDHEHLAICAGGKDLQMLGSWA